VFWWWWSGRGRNGKGEREGEGGEKRALIKWCILKKAVNMTRQIDRKIDR